MSSGSSLADPCTITDPGNSSDDQEEVQRPRHVQQQPKQKRRRMSEGETGYFNPSGQGIPKATLRERFISYGASPDEWDWLLAHAKVRVAGGGHKSFYFYDPTSDVIHTYEAAIVAVRERERRAAAAAAATAAAAMAGIQPPHATAGAVASGSTVTLDTAAVAPEVVTEQLMPPGHPGAGPAPLAAAAGVSAGVQAAAEAAAAAGARLSEENQKPVYTKVRCDATCDAFPLLPLLLMPSTIGVA